MLRFPIIIYSLSCFVLLSLWSCNKNGETIPNPLRFDEEINKIKTIPFDKTKDRIVFTGSSSIRMWQDIQSYYPKHQIINTGFGGSEMSDLLYYIEPNILRFAPSKVFIYEGDNDVNSKRSTQAILNNTKKVVEKIEEKYPLCQIILIAAKPSLARWNLKTEYEELNKVFQAFANQKSNRHFANVWSIMLDDKGEVKSDIFIEDGLHMNKAGYDLWDKIIRPFVEE